jgi:hypothetical protein
MVQLKKSINTWKNTEDRWIFWHPKKWHTMAEWWYTTSFHTSLKMAPFHKFYGRPSPLLAELVVHIDPDMDSQAISLNHQQISSQLKR